jgi:hypothetical protein
MRMGIVSALCVFALLICSPHPAAAQSNPASTQMPQPFLRSLQSQVKPSELPKSTQSDAADFRAEFSSALTNELRTNKKLLFLNDQQQPVNGMGMEAPVETISCAHILIYKAPVVDSKMIIEAPAESTGDKPKLGGVQVCREDLRMAAMSPQTRPRVAHKPNLGLLLVHIRP